MFDFGAFWVPFWSHFGLQNRPARPAMLGLKASKTASSGPWRPKTESRRAKTRPSRPQDTPGGCQECPRPPPDPPRPSKRTKNRSKADLRKMGSNSIFYVLLLFSSVCSSLSLLSRLFSLPSVFFCLLYSFFSPLSFLLFFLSIFFPPLSLSFFRFSSFSSLLALFPNCGGELTYWGALGAILERPSRQSDFGSFF